MNKRLKVLLGAFVFVALAASFTVSTRLTGQVADPGVVTADAFQTCLNMDVTRDGVITSLDYNTARANLIDPNGFKACWNLTGDAMKKCKAFDVDKNNEVDILDYMTVRQYTLNAANLMTCVDDSEQDAFAQCQNMDVTRDGIITNLDQNTVRAALVDPNSNKNCAILTGDARTKCNALDVDKNDLIELMDYMAVRQYSLNPANLMTCKSTVSACSNPSSTDLLTEMNNQVDSRVNDIVASASTTTIWSKRGTDITPWERNVNAWPMRGEKPLDLTGVSPWNSYGTWRQAGALISPRHVVYAYHYAIPIGKKIGFVGNDNVLVTRTLIASKQVPGTDIQVGVLDSDVPSSISFYPIISRQKLLEYLPPLKAGQRVPKLFSMLALDQRDNVPVKEVYQIGDVSVVHSPYIVKTPNPNGTVTYTYPDRTSRLMTHRDTFDRDLVTGDSGDVGMLVINNRLALFLTHSSPGAGPLHGAFIPQINQVMTDLGGGYQVTEFDLSCFTKP